MSTYTERDALSTSGSDYELWQERDDDLSTVRGLFNGLIISAVLWTFIIWGVIALV